MVSREKIKIGKANDDERNLMAKAHMAFGELMNMSSYFKSVQVSFKFLRRAFHFHMMLANLDFQSTHKKDFLLL